MPSSNGKSTARASAAPEAEAEEVAPQPQQQGPTLQDAYAEACTAIGELTVSNRLMMKEMNLQRQMIDAYQQQPPPVAAADTPVPGTVDKAIEAVPPAAAEEPVST